MRNTFRLANSFIFILAISCITYSQEAESYKSSQSKVIKDDVLGISFPEIGKVEKVDSSSYRMILNTTNEGSRVSPVARISVSSRLFVDLPGSYGGRLYLDSPRARRLLKNNVYIDTIESGPVKFTRQYWTVYAGMGTWECVVNCYARESSNYYIISLSKNVTAGKPGEHVDGKQLTAGQIKARLLSSLRDTSNVMVQQFNKLVTSFQINR
ncbi:MAG: hypothetical protein M1470_11490 [Bacteroidetes bacterium]|nr:hypothetical protein [Bacteroidota bacterium]MCL5737616.1 hypothetical protein [Bacteroidota bacterium]